MRLIGQLDDAKDAQRFSSYLITQGVAVHVDESDGQFEIWAKDEDQLEQAVQALAAYQKDPNNEKYSLAVNQANRLAREQAQKRKSLQKNIVNVRDRDGNRPVVTLILIAICVVVALATDFGDAPPNNFFFRTLTFLSVPAPQSTQVLLASGGNLDHLQVRLASILHGEVWRLVTPIFIHYGAFHILFNMMWLYQLGRLIELRYGKWNLLLLVLVTAVISNFAQGVAPSDWDGSTPGLLPDGTLTILFGGFSGVVYGLLGFVWMKAMYDRSSRFYLPQSTIVIMVGWMLFCMIPGATEQIFGMSVANWAHGVGLAVGALIGYLPLIKTKWG